MNRPERLKELYAQSRELRRQMKALDEEIETVRRGCGKRLAPGEWFGACGANDMGSEPAFCTECGGTFKLAEDATS